jgi:hypothetical protein
MIRDPDYDPLSVLTLAELDNGSRLIKADLIHAITAHTEKRWEAMAVAMFLLARREDPKAKLETYRQMTPTEFGEFVDERAPMIPDPGDDEEENPADPTDSGPGSSSPAPGE